MSLNPCILHLNLTLYTERYTAEFAEWLLNMKPHYSTLNLIAFWWNAYADVDTYVDTYADLKYRGRASIVSNN